MKRPIRNWGLSIVLLLGMCFSWPQTDSVAAPDLTSKATDAVWQASAGDKPVDVLILLEQDARMTPQSYLPSSLNERQAYVYQTLLQTANESQQELRLWLSERNIAYRSFYIVNAIQAKLNVQDVLALVHRADVKQIITNPSVHSPLPRVEDTIAIQQADTLPYGLSTIGAPDMWAQGITGQGIVIAGQDTGYEWDHPALINSYRGWDGANADHDYNWHDAIHSVDSSCGTDSPVPCDDHYHGTHTMGTMVGDDGLSNTIGVAPGAQWIGCRNMAEGVGTPATYIECFEFFLAPYPVNGGPDQGDPAKAPHIINNSWSCPLSEGCDAAHTALLEQAVASVRAAGIMVVVSATNDGSACDTVTEPPATFASAYSIGATDSADAIAPFSSRGLPGTMKPNLSAPGVSVYSSLPGGGYGSLSGTSMSAPHVAGAAALLWSARPELIGNVTQTEAVLNATAKPLFSTQCGDAAGALPNSVFGWGRLDIAAAVSAGTLSGTVTTQDGVPLNGVLVSAQPLSGYTRSITSTVNGTYQRILPAGTYTITASLPGFYSVVVDGIVIAAGESITRDFSLSSCQAIGRMALDVAPYPPLHASPSVYTATVDSGDQPITYTWTFSGTTQLEGNPVTQTLLWDIGVQTYTVTVTATNACGESFFSQVVDVLAPIRLFLPVAIK